jgi:Glycosyl transferases group 1
MNFFKGKNILIISTESWSHIPVSKHHYSAELAKNGSVVYFLNPPADKNEIQEVATNLFVVDYKTIKGINRLPSLLRNLFNKRLIKKIRSICNASFDVVWTFDPNRFQNLSLFKAKAKIYHTVDVHHTKLEYEIADSADVIISVSDLILNKLASSKARKIKVNHGVRSHFFQQTPPQARGEIKSIGYVGNLDNFCIHIETLLNIVENNKAITFNFIGPYKPDSPLAAQLKKYDHCRLIGRVPTEELPEYFSKVDLFLMTYDSADQKVNSNHHKILEFLSTGKPTVINFTDEYKNHRDVVIMADRNEELPGLLKQVVDNPLPYFSPELVQKRIQFARANSYQTHIETISKITSEVIRSN